MSNKQNKPSLIMDKVKNRIYIHPEFKIVFDFLMKIEEETKEFLGYQQRLEKIRKQVTELLELMIKMRPDDNFSFSLKEHPQTLSDKLHFIRPIRSEFIVLFAHLETLRCLQTAYDKKISDRQKLRDASDESIESFINIFCLCKENQWVKNNPKRAGKISAKTLRGLRSSLTHFFSVNKIGLAPIYDSEMEDMSKKTNNKIQFITSDDFEEMLSSAAKIMLEKWSSDCKASISNNDDNFIERMRCVTDVVEKNGARFIYENKLQK